MSDAVDTSAEAVERLIADATSEPWEVDAAATLRALLARVERTEAERDAAKREAEQWQTDRNRWHKHAREAENDREALARAIVGETGASAILSAKRVIRERDAARAEAAKLREVLGRALANAKRPAGGWLDGEHIMFLNRIEEICAAALAAKEPGHDR